MLSLRKLVGTTIYAQDGSAGRIRDVLFDATTWEVTGLLVETGGWFHRRRFIVSPDSLVPASGLGEGLISTLNKAQFLQSEVKNHLNQRHEESQICGCQRLLGYRLLATPEAGLGRLKDLTIDETTWRVRFLMITTGSFGGYKLLVCANRALVLEPRTRSARLGFPIVAT